MGLELESYSIALPRYRICRELHFPRRSSVEKGERFTRDWSIGSEYNSRVSSTIREAFFLLKTGLRKYSAFRYPYQKKEWHVIFPVGGWTNRFAGGHIHLGFPDRKLAYEEAKSLASYLHDHIPFVIVLCANSPVWHEKVTSFASNRLLRGTNRYCKITRRDHFSKHGFQELVYNKGGKRKSSTLEIRVCDSSTPEHLIAALCVCQAAALRWMRRQRPLNRSTHANYLKSRDNAVRKGVKARLAWGNHWLSVPQYTDLFFRKYERELKQVDIPHEVIQVFKYLKRGWSQAEVIRKAAQRCRRRYRGAWQRGFARLYSQAIRELMDGNSYAYFSRRLGVTLPNITRTWLGRKGARW